MAEEIYDNSNAEIVHAYQFNTGLCVESRTIGLAFRQGEHDEPVFYSLKIADALDLIERLQRNIKELEKLDLQ